MEDNDHATELLGRLETGIAEFKSRHESQIRDLRAEFKHLETRLTRPGLGGGGLESRHDAEHSAAFTDFLRRPGSVEARSRLASLETKAASGASPAAGGYLIPAALLGPFSSRLTALNPFRSLVRVVQVATRDVSFPLSNANGATGWIAENGTRTATAESTIDAPRPSFGSLYRYVSVSEELAADSAFDVASWFTTDAATAMAEAEMTAIITGDGSAKPSGLFKVAPAATADGSRTAGALKYLASGHASTLGSAPADRLIDLTYSLAAGYRSSAVWVMNSTTAATIRKLKDLEGRFLWADSLAAGQPSTLLGYPLALAESMPDIGENAHPIAFGDFSRGYLICENGGLRVTVDDNVTAPGLIKFYIRRRLGGVVYDNNAIRVLKIAES